MWCHLMTDGDTEELRRFARRLGVPDRALQCAGSTKEHYDLPERLREEAIALGAIPVTAHELVRRCIRAKRE